MPALAPFWVWPSCGGQARGLLNEAGQGTGPHASSAAAVSHPAKQGLVQAFSVYIDTLFVCSATGFMLLITGLYNVQGPDGAALYTGIAGVAAGPGYVQTAMESMMPGFGSMFVAIALFFFAFTTIVAYYYIAETNIAYINRKVNRPWLTFVLKLTLMASTVYGTVKTAELAWGMGDIGVGLMAWLNIIAILLLQRPPLPACATMKHSKPRGWIRCSTRRSSASRTPTTGPVTAPKTTWSRRNPVTPSNRTRIARSPDRA